MPEFTITLSDEDVAALAEDARTPHLSIMNPDVWTCDTYKAAARALRQIIPAYVPDYGELFTNGGNTYLRVHPVSEQDRADEQDGYILAYLVGDRGGRPTIFAPGYDTLGTV